MDNRLEKHLKKFKKRIFLRRFLRYFLASITISLILVFIVVVLSKFYPLFIKESLILILLILPLIISLLYAFIKKATSFEAAREADYNGLDEIVSSAYEYSLKDSNSEIEDELYEKAIKKLENMESINRVKILTNNKLLIIISVFVLIIIPINMLKTEISDSVNSELKEIKIMDEMEKEIEKKVEKIDGIDSKELLKELKEALKDIHNPEKIDEEIFKAKKKLNEEVKNKIKSELAKNESLALSEKQKDDILSSENALETLGEMLSDSEINKNDKESEILKELSDSVSDENAKESEEAIDKLEELKEKIEEHNESSDSRAGTWSGSSKNGSVGATSNLNKVLDKNANKSVNLKKESSSSSSSKVKSSSSKSGKGGNGANIADNGDKDFEKLYESTFINSSGHESSLNSAYKDFEEYEKMKTLGLGDTEEAKVLKNRIVDSYINSQINKSSDDEVPEALKTMIKEYYENIGDN